MNAALNALPMQGLHVMQHFMAMASLPVNLAARTAHGAFSQPFLRQAFPHVAGAAALADRLTRHYRKPGFNIPGLAENIVLRLPFCDLLHFRREGGEGEARPKILLVAPMSGHYATLLRDTVAGLSGKHDVFITDWKCASQVPLSAGSFNLDDYIVYMQKMIRHVGGDAHVMAVCQPGVPVLAAVALMEESRDPRIPRSMILLGSPMDTRINPTAVNRLATDRGVDWFRDTVLTTVPFYEPGAGRRIYPGYSQLYGFMAMNLERHVNAHVDLFNAAAGGDAAAVKRHDDFYDEYKAVMSLDAAFYMQTIDRVFVNHLLPRGAFIHTDEAGRQRRVDPAAIRRVALMTVEGERDDITGLGQTMAAHDLCVNLPCALRAHYMQEGAGHYGIFSGARWRKGVLAQVENFIAGHERPALRPAPARHRAVLR